MNVGITFEKIWFDDDLVELRISSSDGTSVFVNKVYAGHQTVENLVVGLSAFKHKVYGGIYDIVFGEFGPEYASGAFHARLHFQDRGKVHITAKSQSSFEDFGKKNVASEATIYMISEPALLDNFIAELDALRASKRDDAKLECFY